MNRRRVLGLLGAGGAGVLLPLGLSGCGFEVARAGFHCRMTVEVATAQGLKSGSSVFELITSKNAGILTSQEIAGGGGMRGEAVVVDLPDGPLFVLLQRASGGLGLMGMIDEALIPAAETQHYREDGDIDVLIASYRKLGNAAEGSIRGDYLRYRQDARYMHGNTPVDLWPLMVRFGDLNDPKTVEAVDPHAIGVTRIWVETTKDAVTTGIEKRLGWLLHHNGSLAYDGSLHPDHPEKDINQHAFWYGVEK